mgnify:CR=1 FL=1
MNSLFFKEEHKMIQKMVCEFANDEILLKAKELDKNKSFPKKHSKKMGQFGLMGISIPVEYGRSRIDTVAYFTVIMELAKIDASELLVYHVAWLKDKGENFMIVKLL